MVGCLLSVSMLRSSAALERARGIIRCFRVEQLIGRLSIALATSSKRDEARPRHAQRRETVLR